MKINMEKLQNLYRKLVAVSADYLIYQRRTNIEEIKKIIPQIQEFVLWFMDENIFGIEEEIYQGMCQNLLLILEDILAALKNNDQVLLQDAVAHGLMEYLELFVSEEQGEEENGAI